ncbi:MAG: homoserine kinase [Chloroflexi bacterium]|nr:homoserine kinase [Chloroflexota bacterium]
MTPKAVIVRVPATSANLGPGFDCLGMALELWNSTEFIPQDAGHRVEIHGEGQGRLPENDENLILQSFAAFNQAYGVQPSGVRLVCRNEIPVSSGLGSSAAAILTGLLGANALAGSPASRESILRLAIQIEGHPDNVTAALLGGLVVAILEEGTPVYRRFEMAPLSVGLVLPDVALSTQAARDALPARVSRLDAVYGLGRAALVVEALRQGDLSLLAQVMDDRLHQPYRLPLIPGAEEAMQAGLHAGARAVALSGAGPGLIVFPCLPAALRNMEEAFAGHGINARLFELGICNTGAIVQFD